MVRPAGAIDRGRTLTPEEDAVDDPDDLPDEVDDELPGDLWFRHRWHGRTDRLIGFEPHNRQPHDRYSSAHRCFAPHRQPVAEAAFVTT